jgi:uncharacterized protein YndB with AHSA1/START domain
VTQQSLDPPDPARLGTVRELADGYQLRFERHFRHPLEKVWAALTTPSDRAEWFAPGEIELTLGGRVALAFTDGKSVVDGEVTAIEPPRLLEFTWDDNGDDHGSVRWELAREDEGTHLILTHTLSNASRQFGLPALAGWHTLLEKLTVLLDGQSTSGLSERWQEFHDHYAALEMLDDQFSTKGDTTK